MVKVYACPGCQKLPIIYFSQFKKMFRGGCFSRDTDLCRDLFEVVLQSDLEAAKAQWNEIVKPIRDLLAKGA